MTTPSSPSTVLTVDLRPAFPPVRDQATRPICTAIAGTAAHAYCRGNDVLLSPEYLHYHATCAQPAQGVSFSALKRTLAAEGQCAEADCAMAMSTPAAGWKPTVGLTVYRRLSVEETADPSMLQQILNNRRAPIAGCGLSIAFASATATTVISGDPTFLTKHAMVVVGLGTHHGSRVFLLRNSWGALWADAGHVLVDDSFVDINILELLVPTVEP